MRTFAGMILGVILTIAVIYVYDSRNGSAVANSGTRTIVNWDVAASDWEAIKTRTRATWAKLTEG